MTEQWKPSSDWVKQRQEEMEQKLVQFPSDCYAPETFALRDAIVRSRFDDIVAYNGLENLGDC